MDNDSGSRRVRKRVEACRYILDIWEEACREEVEFERGEPSNWEEDKRSLVLLIVAVAVEAIARGVFFSLLFVAAGEEEVVFICCGMKINLVPFN